MSPFRDLEFRVLFSTGPFACAAFIMSEGTPLMAGLGVCISVTRLGTQALSYTLIQKERIQTLKEYIIFEMAAATLIATITTVALCALINLPLFSLGTLSLISISVIPSWIDTWLTADYLRLGDQTFCTWREYFHGVTR